MGSLVGHLLPGCCFITWGLMVILVSWKHYHESLHDPKAARYSTACHPADKTRHGTVVKFAFLALAVIGMIGELVTGVYPSWTYDDIQNNLQHMTMFGAFALHFTCESWMTTGMFDYITLVLAFSSEAYLFGNHLHGRTVLDKKLHGCLTVAIVFNTISVAAEALLPKTDVRPVLIRGATTLWQGTWFVHIALVSYSVPILGELLVWKQVDLHANAMLTDSLFVGHLLGITVLTIGMGVAVERQVKGATKSISAKYESLKLSDSNFTNSLLEGESDSESLIIHQNGIA